jgi:F0F1-type ATP synthase epsilon subunit
MPSAFKLNVVTPDGAVFSSHVEQRRARGVELSSDINAYFL